MLSLSQLRAKFPTILLIDAASTRIQVGLLSSKQPDCWKSQTTEAGTGVFSGIFNLGQENARIRLNDVDGFLFCEGPGSVLGIRTAAIALRVWSTIRERPIFAYSSLRLVATFQLQTGAATPFSVIADARRDTWHCLTVDATREVGPLRRGNSDTFVGQTVTPLEFRNWAPLPNDTLKIPYTVEKLLAASADQPLFHEVTDPDAFLHEEPIYLTWTPQIHRAPS
ncbi:MAG TPA: hypothetical protein VFT72_09200 [Opitutaceae bacterium]|nr:hypothetical protein [Opitutaceae bacterium]